MRFVAAMFVVSWCMAAWPQEAAAQRRAVPRKPVRSVVVVAPRYYSPFLYDPYFSRPFYGGFYNPYFFGWYGHYPYPPYRYPFAYDRTGSARLEVTPREAEVYVDGYFVGIVDDFDGVFQRLRIPPGEHELQLYLEGYRTFRQKVLFTPGNTVKIVHTMPPLGPGETNESRPQGEAASRVQPSTGPRESRQYGRAQRADFGTLSLQVQPDDSIVVIDGAEWDRPEGESRFLVDLPQGPHQVEVHKEGFRTYTRTVHVQRGRTATLNVSLTRAGGHL